MRSNLRWHPFSMACILLSSSAVRSMIHKHTKRWMWQGSTSVIYEDFLTIVKRRKLQWYGHVSCSAGLAKTILQGTLKGEEDLVSKLVSWCFEPSQAPRITSGLNTNFTLSPCYSFHKSSYHKLFFLAYSYSADTQHGNRLRQGDLFYSVGQHRNHVLATANTGEIGGRFGKKMQLNGPER